MKVFLNQPWASFQHLACHEAELSIPSPYLLWVLPTIPCALWFNSIIHCRSFDVVRFQKVSLQKALHTCREALRRRYSKEAKRTLELVEGCENFTTLNQHLIDARQRWSEKQRLFCGKAQEIFRELCRIMGVRKTILDVFPDSNDYKSMFCAAFNTISTSYVLLVIWFTLLDIH